jgi:hypothetical protein
MNIVNLTEHHLFEIVNIATGGYFSSEFSSHQKEIETGGYGKRRLVEWILDDEKNYFELNGESKERGWHWYAWCFDKEGKKHNVNTLNASGIIDYCDKNNIDVRNKTLN